MQTAQFQLHAEIEERHWWFVARRRILAEVVHAVLPPSLTTTIVDVGCGTGANLSGLSSQYECIGIDTSQDAIHLARKRFPQVHFLRGFAPHDLGAIVDRTQLVMLNDVLEHVADDFELFSSLLAAVRPGCYMLLTVPADLSLWSQHDVSFGHYRRYDAARLASIWRGLPVEPIFVSHFNSRLYPVVKAVRCMSRLRGEAGGAAGTDFRMPGPRVNAALTSVFAGESKRLSRLARGEVVRPYQHGVSLMALLRREPGLVGVRTRPEELPADVHDPAAQLAAV